MLTLTPQILKPSKSSVKKKGSIARFFSQMPEGAKYPINSLCPKKKTMDCNDMEVVFVDDDSNVKQVRGDGKSMEKEKSKQQPEAVSINKPLNNELSEDEKRGCCVLQSSSLQTAVEDLQNNTKDEEMCTANRVVVMNNDKKRNYYSEGTEEEQESQAAAKLNGSEQDTVAVPLIPVKKKVKVMVENEKENGEWTSAEQKNSCVNVSSVELAKQDIETPKEAAVMTDDEDCSEGGSIEDDKSKYLTPHAAAEETNSGVAYNLSKINNMSSVIKDEVSSTTIGMATTPIPGLKVESDACICLDQVVDSIVVTPQRISATAATDSSSTSTPATTVSAPEMDASASIHKKPSCCSEEVAESPAADTINGGNGGLSTEITHYELQLEEAVSLFGKLYKERPDNTLGLVEVIDYAIQEEEKKLMLKDGHQQQQHSTDVVSTSNENSSFTSFPDALCPALSCIIQGSGSRLDTLVSMAFQTVTVALEERLGLSSSSSDKTKLMAINTLLQNVTEANVKAKIPLLAVHRAYGNPPPKATITSMEDKTPSACWIWEVQCIEALPGKCAYS